MLTITDQLNLANILTLESRESNVIYVGSNLKVETIPEYLARVDIFSRYLGLEVIIVLQTGEYTPTDYLNLVSLGSITYKKYVFANNLTDLVPKDSMLQSDKYYHHSQGIPASAWNINHNLNKRPSVTVTDSAGTVVTGAVSYVDENNIIITFSADFSGNAELN